MFSKWRFLAGYHCRVMPPRIYNRLRYIQMSLWGCLALLLSASLSGFTDVEVDGSSVIVNGVEVVEILTEAGGHSVEERARIIADLIASAEGVKSEAVRGVGLWTVEMNGKSLVTITLVEAKAHELDAGDMAKQVSVRLNKALAQEPFRLGRNSLELEPSAVVSVEVIGTKADQLKLTVPEGLEAGFKEGKLELKALKPGLYELGMSAAESKGSLSVRVLLPSFAPKESYETIVFGRPASSESVKSAALSSVHGFSERF